MVAINWLALQGHAPTETERSQPICSGCRKDGALVSAVQRCQLAGKRCSNDRTLWREFILQSANRFP